jgi:hypothetical protein
MFSNLIATVRATKTIKVLLPAESEWSEPFDICGFSELWPMLADGVSNNFQVVFETSADGLTWGTIENLQVFNVSADDAFNELPLSYQGHTIKAPYIRFANNDAVIDIVPFSLYCIA